MVSPYDSLGQLEIFMDYRAYILYALFIWNATVFLLYGLDKRKAQKGKRRVSERTLLLTAFLIGGVGAISGMWFFKHKTKHRKFMILLPIFVILNIVVVFAIYNL